MFLLAQNTSALGSIFGKFLNLIFDFIYNISPTCSLFFTIIAFTILVKLILLPLAIKQQKSMKRTQAMQPELKALQDKYKDKNDPESQQQMAAEMQALYSKHGTNPFTSCLLSFIQLPIVIALFDVFKGIHLYIDKLGVIYTNLSEMVLKVPGYETILNNLGTAKKLAATDYTLIDNVKTLFTTLTTSDWTALTADLAANIDVNAVSTLLEQKNQIETIFGINLVNRPVLASVSVILPIITVLITFLSMRSSMSSQNTEGMDEQTKNMMGNMNNFMKIIIVSIFFTSMSLPAAISIYWSLTNIIQLIQQKAIKKYVK